MTDRNEPKILPRPRQGRGMPPPLAAPDGAEASPGYGPARLNGIAQVCAGLTVLMGLLAGVGWMSGFLLLAQVSAAYVPMAQSTLLCFCALGATTFMRARWPHRRHLRPLSGLAATAVLLCCGLLLGLAMAGAKWDIEGAIFGNPGFLQDVPLGRMSSFTAGLFMLCGLSILFSLADAERARWRALAADILACLVVVSGLAVLFAYWCGRPVLYGGRAVPPALSTALAFVLLGVAELALTGTSGWPLREFLGPSLRATLLRVLLPTTVTGVLFQARLELWQRGDLSTYSVFISALWAAVVAACLGAAILFIVRRRTDALDQVQEALRASEESRRSLLDHLPIGIAHTAPDGTILYQNPHARALWGYTEQELSGLNAGVLYVRPEDREELVRNLGEKGEHSFVYPLRRKNGEVFWGRGTTRAIRDERGQAVYQGFLEDFTERMQAEAALARAQQWQLCEQAVRLAIAQMIAPESLNEVVAEVGRQLPLLGASEFESISLQVVNDDRTDFVIVGPTRQDRLAHALWRAGASWRGTGETPGRFPWVIEVFRSGTPRHEPCAPEGGPMQPGMSLIDVPFSHGTLAINHRRSYAFTDNDVALLARLAGVVSDGFQRFLDLVRHRQADEAITVDLALQRVRNEVLRMHAEEDWGRLVAVVDTELRRLLPFHQATITVVDLQTSRAGTHSVQERGPDGPVSDEADRLMFTKALETGQSVYRASRADPLFSHRLAPEVNSVVDVPFLGGTLGVNRTEEDAFDPADIQLLERFAPVLSEAHRRLQDLSERRQLEGEMIRVQRLHAAAELSAGVCHNLNNILTGVLTPAQILQSMTDDHDIRQMIDTIVVAAERAAALVHQLHQAVHDRPDAPLQAVVVGREIHRVLEVTRPRWQDEPQAQGVAIKVRTELGEVEPIRATEAEFESLLTNLLFNAVDAMPEGGTITIRTQSEGDQVRLDFSDTGIGMDEATRLRVFEPFFTTKAGIGTGLGLATLHNAVTQWGGTVVVDSAPGQGATFILRLPVWRGEIPAASHPQEGLTSRPGRILIVDDNETVARLLVTALCARHQVDAFVDATQALARFTADRYDVAIIDLGLPGIPGDQLAQRLQELDPAVVRILFSGWELAEDDPRRRPFEFQLTKPAQDLGQLEALIAQAMALHDHRAGAARAGSGHR